MDVLPIVPLALLLDILIGDPVSKWHPVRQLGYILDGGQRTLRSMNVPELPGGVAMTLLGIVFIVGGYLLMYSLVFPLLPGYVVLIVHAVLLSLCMSFRSMFDHALSIVIALRENELDEARDALRPMVRRDADHLDHHGIARAAIEALSNGFVNTCISPVFWFCTGALAGLWVPFPIVVCGVSAVLLHCTIRTLDDVLHAERTTRTFGWFSSLLNLLMDFLPARLAVPFLFAGSLFTSADTDLGGRTWLRHRRKHNSPNTGQTESFMAGALHIRLGGPKVYPDRVVEQPWMGEGTPDATEVHVKACVRLVFLAGAIAFLCAFLFLVGLEQVHRSMLSPY